FLLYVIYFFYFFFFFQAEDGIRDLTVTGVQTCALPILFSIVLILRECAEIRRTQPFPQFGIGIKNSVRLALETGRQYRVVISIRSEERRVGKECRSQVSKEQ